MTLSVNRRQILKGAAGLGAAGLLGRVMPSTAPVPTTGRRRVAIVGGGAGGIMAAYFLAGSCDVTVFEALSKIGGHCDSRQVDYQGTPLTVDVGAQFFHPATHPIYVTLLEQLGLYDPNNPDGDSTIEAPGSVCVFSRGESWPRFSSTEPLLTPVYTIDFAIYAEAARQAVLDNTSWEVRVDDWIDDLPVTPGFKDVVLLPWISALIGTTQANAAGSSVRSILQSFALAFPADLLAGASTYNSTIGLEGNLHRMLDLSPTVQVRVNSPVQSVAFDGQRWSVSTSTGTHDPFDAVVMNAPPHNSTSILSGLPWAADIVGLLGQYGYFDSRIVIHDDPIYLDSDRDLWAVYNAEVTGVDCEGSVWLGGIEPKLANGHTVDVFKSWTEHRSTQPSAIVFDRAFQHPLITPDVIRATRALHATQGRNGLYFSGQYTTGMDLQEACVYSAMQVADALAPDSATLASLRALLAQKGLSGISYDV
ncbi:MAG TPA: FAD-dependent oxidoreductase [Pseudonocardiaceae bacterium]